MTLRQAVKPGWIVKDKNMNDWIIIDFLAYEDAAIVCDVKTNRTQTILHASNIYQVNSPNNVSFLIVKYYEKKQKELEGYFV